jgi:uncharacterized protein
VGLTALASAVVKQRRTLQEIDHRPWPLPHRPWFMGQTWCDLLFMHWRVDPAVLERVVPPQLPLDVRDGSAWIGVTPFTVMGFRLHGTPPVPFVATFPELNVRTYVTVDGKPGIFFHSLDAGSSLAVAAARRSYRLPYFRARAELERQDGTIRYESRRVNGPDADFAAEYRGKGPDPDAEDGSLARWLAERYCLYSIDEQQRIMRADIHHPPWPLERATGTIERNTMARPLGIELEGEPLLHYSARQDTVIWRLREAK